MEIREHAILYALICKSISKYFDKEEAEDLIKKITISYGQKRGRRMRDNSEEGSLDEYFINGEWRGKEGENISVLNIKDNKTISTVKKCAWYDNWQKYNLLEYGRYYCKYIDSAICEGYGSSFSLDVEKNMGNGDENCIFVFNDVIDQDKVKDSERKYIKDFSFHTKELYECFVSLLPEDKKEITKNEVKKEYEELTKQKLMLY